MTKFVPEYTNPVRTLSDDIVFDIEGVEDDEIDRFEDLNVHFGHTGWQQDDHEDFDF